MQKLLQVNFRLTVSASEWGAIASDVAPMFEALPGLTWKIWGLSEQEDEVCGWYLFADEESLRAFLDGPIPKQVQSAPFQTGFSAKIFDVTADVTARTRGPVNADTAAPVLTAQLVG